MVVKITDCHYSYYIHSFYSVQYIDKKTIIVMDKHALHHVLCSDLRVNVYSSFLLWMWLLLLTLYECACNMISSKWNNMNGIKFCGMIITIVTNLQYKQNPFCAIHVQWQCTFLIYDRHSINYVAIQVLQQICMKNTIQFEGTCQQTAKYTKIPESCTCLETHSWESHECLLNVSMCLCCLG